MSEVELEVLGEFLEKLRLQKQEERKQVDEQIENLRYRSYLSHSWFLLLALFFGCLSVCECVIVIGY